MIRRTKLKVCCIRSVEEARMAMECGVEAIGLVSAMPSGPGVIDEETIAEIANWAPKTLDTFLLTSLTDAAAIIVQHGRCGTSTIQLCRSLTPACFGTLRRHLREVRLVQVIHVEGEESVEEAIALAPFADALLLDSGRPNAAVPELGGTGRVHDWTLAKQIVEAVGCPVWLAGGLRPENAAEAIRKVHPHGLDICSGIRSDGELDRDRLEAMIRSMGG